MIKRELDFETISFPFLGDNEIFEYTILKLTIQYNRNLFIISAYVTNDGRQLFTAELDF